MPVNFGQFLTPFAEVNNILPQTLVALRGQDEAARHNQAAEGIARDNNQRMIAHYQAQQDQWNQKQDQARLAQKRAMLMKASDNTLPPEVRRSAAMEVVALTRDGDPDWLEFGGQGHPGQPATPAQPAPQTPTISVPLGRMAGSWLSGPGLPGVAALGAEAASPPVPPDSTPGIDNLAPVGSVASAAHPGGPGAATMSAPQLATEALMPSKQAATYDKAFEALLRQQAGGANGYPLISGGTPQAWNNAQQRVDLDLDEVEGNATIDARLRAQQEEASKRLANHDVLPFSPTNPVSFDTLSNGTSPRVTPLDYRPGMRLAGTPPPAAQPPAAPIPVPQLVGSPLPSAPMIMPEAPTPAPGGSAIVPAPLAGSPGGLGSVHLVNTAGVRTPIDLTTSGPLESLQQSFAALPHQAEAAKAFQYAAAGLQSGRFKNAQEAYKFGYQAYIDEVRLQSAQQRANTMAGAQAHKTGLGEDRKDWDDVLDIVKEVRADTKYANISDAKRSLTTSLELLNNSDKDPTGTSERIGRNLLNKAVQGGRLTDADEARLAAASGKEAALISAWNEWTGTGKLSPQTIAGLRSTLSSMVQTSMDAERDAQMRVENGVRERFAGHPKMEQFVRYGTGFFGGGRAPAPQRQAPPQVPHGAGGQVATTQPASVNPKLEAAKALARKIRAQKAGVTP